MNRLTIIANLAANNYHDQSSFDRFVVDFFEERGYEVEFFGTDTLDKLDAYIQKSLAQGCKQFITIGGDGSLHYLLNSLLNYAHHLKEIQVAVLPKGTGNDYIRNFSFPNKRSILNAICLSQFQPIDIGEIQLKNDATRFFINMLGIGFSAAVVKNVGKYKWLGSLAYYFALLETFTTYRSRIVSIEIDGQKVNFDCFWMCVGIGKYAGGNMKLCPMAVVDDGCFNIHLIQNIKFWKLLRYIHTLRDGSYLKYIDVQTFKAQSILIQDLNGLNIEADGELITSKVSKINIIERAIQFVRNN